MKAIQGILTIGFLVALFIARGWQEEEHAQDIFASLMSECNNDFACEEILNTYGQECIERNLITHKAGKYSRDHTLDERGFRYCIKRKVVGFEPEGSAKPEPEVAESEVEYSAGNRFMTVKTGSHEVKLLNNHSAQGSSSQLQQYTGD